MNKRNVHVRKFFLTSPRAALSVVLLTAVLVGSTAASTVTDGSTPLALTPGAPAGSYPLSGLDNVNLYNGALNFRLPLLEVGGRGGARQTLGRMIEQHWRMDHAVLPDQTEVHTPFYNPWTPLDPGYSPGVLYGRQVNDGGCAQGLAVEGTLTRLTFVNADGTEFELRDKNTGGDVRTSYCANGGGAFVRGSVFVTADGTSATFVSDAPISDFVGGSGSSHFYPTGYLMLRDGTRYRVINGRVSSVRDRNGNQISYSYPGTGMVITDSLGRQITVTLNVSDAQPYGLCDHITFSGKGGAQRTIRVSKTNLGGALRSGQSLQTPAALFGYGSGSTQHNPQVVSAVWLPDGKSYQFRYNSYGELARVELPTGGAFEYDYAGGLTGGAADGVFFTVTSKPEIYRRLTEKRVYKSGGALEGKMTVGRTDSQYSNDTTVTVDQRDPAGALLSRSKHYFHGNPTKSFEVGPMEHQRWKQGREYRTESFSADGTTVLRRVDNTWQQPLAGASWPLGQAETSEFVKPNNPQITETRTTLVDTNQVSKSTFAYDQYNNRTDVYEFDFGAGAPPSHATRRTQTTFLTVNPVNGQDYASPNPTAASIHLRSLPQHQRVYSVNTSTGAQTQVAHNETLYDQTSLLPWYGTVTQWADPGPERGNATKTRRWLDPSGTYVETRAEYDQVGNVTKAVDARNKETLIQYASTYAHSLPTQFSSPVPDPTGAHGSNSALTTTRVYDFSTGLVTSSTDPNGKVVTLEYNDPLDRLTKVNRPDGGWTTYAYAANQHGDYIYTVTLVNASGAQLYQYQYFDGLGRPSRSFHGENYDTSKPWLTSDKQYDALGRVWRVSPSYRSAGAGSPVNPSGRWTETLYDALGRVKTVTTLPDDATVTTTYSGNRTTVKDQAGRSRRSVTDALGRITQIVEDPTEENPAGLAYATNYLYDALGNLRKVEQGGQLRYFMYDSLGRLVRARHPEQAANAGLAITDPVTGNAHWSLGYVYDANGNVVTRTDARGVSTTYTYDALNRNKTADYSDTTTLDVARHYDNGAAGANGRGRFWYDYRHEQGTLKGSHTAVDGYDAAGRPDNRRQHFYDGDPQDLGAAFNTQYGYDLTGNVTSVIYPSGRSVSYAYDAAGRLNAFSGNLGDSVSRNYATGIIYDEMGGRRQERFGTDTPVYNKSFYNTRGQLAEIRVSTYSVTTQGQETNWNRGAILNVYSGLAGWTESREDNNGNLRKQMLFVPNDDQISGSWDSTFFYDYDGLNRLDVAREVRGGQNQWVQDFDHDRFGNRTVNQAGTWGGVPETQFTVSTATNRLSVPSGQAGVIQYDAAGNLTSDTYTGAGIRAYDAEGRMTSAQDNAGQTSRYYYDADGRRVRRKVGAAAEVRQVYSAGGELLAEYAADAQPSSPTKEYGYRGGELLVTAEAQTVTNLAFGKTATQSSTYAHALNPVASRAVDGNTDGNFFNSSVSVTNSEAQAWWHVDLGAVGQLNTVRVWNRSDCCAAFLTDFYVLVSDQPFTSTSLSATLAQPGVSAYRTAGQAGRPTSVAVGRAGRYVRVQLAGTNYLEMAEVEVFGPGAGTGPAGVRWLVSDQLGTPRMVIDKTGSLSNLRRHDYLPYGEELYSGIAGRTAQQGYAGDNVRQKFTGYERDAETGLDFAQARYFSSAQGRFTSVDPLLASGAPADPQTWNRYAYALNNPLRYTDPTGTYADGLDQIPNLPDPQLPSPPPAPAMTLPALPEGPVVTDAGPAPGPLNAVEIRQLVEGVNSLLANNNGQCEQFLNEMLFALDPEGPASITTTLHNVTTSAHLIDASGQMNANDYAETRVYGDGTLVIRLNYPKHESSGINSMPYTMVEETMHAAPAQSLNSLYGHYALASAAYGVGRATGVVPGGAQPPKRSAVRGDEADQYNAELFRKAVFTACNPR